MIDLFQIKARCEAATEGPWKQIQFCLNAKGIFFGKLTPKEICSYVSDAISNKFPVRVARDLDFIAHARTDIPDLIEEIERLKKVVKSAFREGGKAGRKTTHASYFDEDNYLWDHSEARKALEQEK